MAEDFYEHMSEWAAISMKYQPKMQANLRLEHREFVFKKLKEKYEAVIFVDIEKPERSEIRFCEKNKNIYAETLSGTDLCL